MRLSQIVAALTVVACLALASSAMAGDIDCNGNGIPDNADIDAGTSQDCNANGVPDECDIAGGITDCNANGVPDECEGDVECVPTVSAWGMASLGLLLLTGATIRLRAFRKAA